MNHLNDEHGWYEPEENTFKHHSINFIINKNIQTKIKLQRFLQPFKFIIHLFIHFSFHLIQSYLIKSSSSNHLNNNNNNNLLYSSNLNNNHSAILITNHSELNPFILQLAINFATIGYHVFLQVSNQHQLSQLILRWQNTKSKLIKNFNKPTHPHHHSFINRIIHSIISFLHPLPTHHLPPSIGTIIPLLYLTPDANQRLEAISTITAYVRQNHIDTISLINVIDPCRIRRSYPSSHSPISSNCSHSRSSQFNPPLPSPHSSPSTSSTRPLTGLASPTHSDHSNDLRSPSTPRSIPLPPSTSGNNELYNPRPIPLSISSDVYLFDALGDTLLGPLSTAQDLLLLLKNHRGRVINIWDGCRYPQTGLTDLLLSGFQKTNQILQAEFENFQIPVSIVYPPFEISDQPVFTKSVRRELTTDPRSLLSEASDPDLLEAFAQQTIKEWRKDENYHGRMTSDPITSFNLVRLVLETKYPSQVYPIGIKQVFDQLIQLSGLNRLYSLF